MKERYKVAQNLHERLKRIVEDVSRFHTMNSAGKKLFNKIDEFTYKFTMSSELFLYLAKTFGQFEREIKFMVIYF